MSESPAEAAASVSEFRFPKFGPLLRKLRTTAGLSQDGLAERAGISAKTIGALEQGVRRAAHDDTIHRIAEALHVSSSERDALFRSAQHSRARRPDNSEDVSQNTLPKLLTTFIERHEVEEIAALLDSNRLVTITGTGGVGKTRTAIEVARRVLHPNHSAWFVDLSRLRDGGAILSEMVSVFGIGLTDAEEADAAVARRLNTHPSLLIIDNCEHLLDGLAELVPQLLQACPHLNVLATSREPLSLSFETVYRLPSLDVPAGRIADMEQALESSAIRLFLNRTDSASAAWLQKPSALEKISTLCRQVDGIPLAIELAASRVSTLGLDMLLENLMRGLTLSGKRDYPARHRTMTATIAWSYDLLDSTEQAVLRRLSVFAGSFSLDIAQRVCADDGLPVYTIVDACHRLAQKSLIVVEHGEQIRYRLLGAIRAFGETRLSPSENRAVHLQYIHWLRDLADSVHHNRLGLPMKSIQADFDNVRAGVERCLEIGGEEDILDAAAIVGGLWLLWFETNRTRELKYYVDHLLESVDVEKQTHIVSRLVLATCSYSSRREFPAAVARAIPVLLADGNSMAISSMLARLANTQFRSGDTEAANQSLRRSFEALNDIDPAVNRAYWGSLLGRAWQSCAQGNISQAIADLEQLATYLNEDTDPDRRERRKAELVAAEVAFASGNTQKAIALLNLDVNDLDSLTPIYRFSVCANLAMYHSVAGNIDMVLLFVRAVIEDLGDAPWSPLWEEYHYILIPAAVAAVVHGKGRFGARLLGHWKHHGLKGRAIWATEAPGYEKVLELLNARFSTGELDELLDEGATVLPREILDYVGSDALFAPNVFAKPTG